MRTALLLELSEPNLKDLVKCRSQTSTLSTNPSYQPCPWDGGVSPGVVVVVRPSYPAPGRQGCCARKEPGSSLKQVCDAEYI